MCERTEALQKLYEEAAKEPIPEDMQALLNRLK
jgi:hypothetical protein